MPTRNARNGTLFTSTGKLHIKNARFTRDPGALDETCTRFSHAYLRHLFVPGQILGSRLLTIHNVHHYLDLMRQMREAIAAMRFDEFRQSFYKSLKPDETEIL